MDQKLVEVAGNKIPQLLENSETKEGDIIDFEDKDWGTEENKFDHSNYVFTVNNPTESDLDGLKECNLHENIRYIIYQLERGEKSGTLHIQGYIELKRSRNWKWMTNNICRRMRARPAKAGAEANKKYCSKSKTKVKGPWEYGTPKQQGKRSDIHKCTELLKNGGNMKLLMKTYPNEFVKYHKGFKELFDGLQEERDGWRPELFIIIGPPGIGKSRVPFEEEKKKGNSIYIKPDCSQWWDKYENQEAVIINEFKGELSITYMNNLIDYYPHSVQVKGGYKTFNSKVVYITSNIEIDQWWPGQDLSSFKRRITKIFHPAAIPDY